MAKGTAGKNYWALLLMILAGVVLGGFIGQLSAGVPALRWLNYGQTFGLSNPLVLDLGILVLTFGLTIKITIAGIIGIVLAILIYRFPLRFFLLFHLLQEVSFHMQLYFHP